MISAETTWDPREGKTRSCVELQIDSIRVLSNNLTFEKKNPQMRWSEDWQRKVKSSGKVWGTDRISDATFKIFDMPLKV